MTKVDVALSGWRNPAAATAVWLFLSLMVTRLAKRHKNDGNGGPWDQTRARGDSPDGRECLNAIFDFDRLIL